MEEFIVMNQENHPELLNFMGFADEKGIDDVDMEDANGLNQLYEDHLSFDELVMGIK